MLEHEESYSWEQPPPTTLFEENQARDKHERAFKKRKQIHQMKTNAT